MRSTGWPRPEGIPDLPREPRLSPPEPAIEGEPRGRHAQVQQCRQQGRQWAIRDRGQGEEAVEVHPCNQGEKQCEVWHDQQRDEQHASQLRLRVSNDRQEINGPTPSVISQILAPVAMHVDEFTLVSIASH